MTWATGEGSICGERLWDTNPQLQAGRRLLSATTALFSGVLLDPRSQDVASRAAKGLMAPPCSPMARVFDAGVSCSVTLYVMCLFCFKPCRSCYRYTTGVSLGKGKFLKQIQLEKMGGPSGWRKEIFRRSVEAGAGG